MVRMWEHIDRLHSLNCVHIAEQRQVAGLCRGVAANIYHTLGCSTLDDLDDALINTCTRRVKDDDIGLAVALDEIIAQHIFHIASIECRVVDRVNHRVYLSILDSLRHILHANNPLGTASAEVGDGASACVEVVERVGGLKVGKVARNLVKLIRLLRVGLIERLRANLEL